MKAGKKNWPLGCQVGSCFRARGLESGASQEGHASLPGILGQVAAAGFIGFEVVALAVPIDSPDALVHKMAVLKLRFAGAHIAEPLWQSNVEASISAAAATASRFKVIGCEHLVVSMAPSLPPEADTGMIRQVAANLYKLGHACRDGSGLPEVFHNHGREMANNAACIDAIVQKCDPSIMQLAPDLGHAAIGGINPVDFVDRFGARIAYLHAQDVSELGSKGRALETGQGVIKYLEVATALERHDFEGWIIAESHYGPSWAGDRDPDHSARLQFKGLTVSLGQDG